MCRGTMWGLNHLQIQQLGFQLRARFRARFAGAPPVSQPFLALLEVGSRQTKAPPAEVGRKGLSAWDCSDGFGADQLYE